MNHQHIIRELNRSRKIFKKQLSSVTKQEYLWKPDPENWCLLEIICHLYDEEREDFRARTKSVLENPESPLASIDPVAWVFDRKYLQQDFEAKTADFLNERKASIKWLKSLKLPNWDNAYHHPKLGPLTAGSFLSNWLAHDYIHIRQILKVRFAYLHELTGEDLSYAGNW